MRLVWEDGGTTLTLGPEEPPVAPRRSTGGRGTTAGPPVDLDVTVNTIDSRAGIDATTSDNAFPNPVGAFRGDIRNAWVDALFGRTDFPSIHSTAVEDDIREDAGNSTATNRPKVPAVEGVGLAGIKSFVAYGAVIPAGAAASSPAATPNASPTKSAMPRGSPTKSVISSITGGTLGGTVREEANADDGTPHQPRLGITLSRIPLGVYVRSVAATSEAYFAGILPGSILVDINGLGVLGEPTHKLLERLWQYENVASTLGGGGSGSGIAATMKGDDEGNGNNGDGSSPNPTNSNQNQHSSSASQYCTYGGIQGPVALRFIRNGRLYTAILLGKAPFGISWGPCGNFALVQRSYSFAESAGVRRGCLVAAVNGRSLRDMDHVDTADELRRLFVGGVSFGFTPAQFLASPISFTISNCLAIPHLPQYVSILFCVNRKRLL